MTFILHLLRYYWTEITTNIIVMYCPISYLFMALSPYVLSHSFQNWNIFSANNNFWRFSMLTAFTFKIKENDRHDLTSRFCLSDFFSEAANQCVSKHFCWLGRGSKWCTYASSTVITVFRKFGHFEASVEAVISSNGICRFSCKMHIQS